MHAVQSSSVQATEQPVAVVTFRNFSAPIEAVWQALMFYEEVTTRPPFLLRSFLPIPLASEGCKFEVGGEVTCRYVEGYLLKRVTQVIERRQFAFEVVEQNLVLRGIRVLEGEYRLRDLSEGNTQVALSTRYQSPNHPRWLCRRIEAAMCHLFHRHILRAMQDVLRAENNVLRG